MKKASRLLILSFFVLLFSHSLARVVYAIADPLSLPNNKFGVHILFPSEINDAASLINSNGGDFGYVTIPIQAGDRDLDKWQKFMDDAKTLHVIPIMRLATENYYFNNNVWRKPEPSDILDFANFLDSLKWPTANRYIIVFNETNRADEWGGETNAAEYAQILSYASDAFKAKNPDFFIISAGLDNAAENNGTTSRNQFTFMQEMYNAFPDVFTKIDGISSHSYPNPGFRQPVNVLSRRSIASFRYEKQLADLLADKDLPVFITETGWSKEEVDQYIIASYYKTAFNSVWSDKSIVAVTPFLLSGTRAGFRQFSLTKENGEHHEDYKVLKEIEKVKGEPLLARTVEELVGSQIRFIPRRDFSNHPQKNPSEAVKSKVVFAERLVKWLLKI